MKKNAGEKRICMCPNEYVPLELLQFFINSSKQQMEVLHSGLIYKVTIFQLEDPPELELFFQFNSKLLQVH